MGDTAMKTWAKEIGEYILVWSERDIKFIDESIKVRLRRISENYQRTLELNVPASDLVSYVILHLIPISRLQKDAAGENGSVTLFLGRVAHALELMAKSTCVSGGAIPAPMVTETSVYKI